MRWLTAKDISRMVGTMGTINMSKVNYYVDNRQNVQRKKRQANKEKQKK